MLAILSYDIARLYVKDRPQEYEALISKIIVWGLG